VTCSRCGQVVRDGREVIEQDRPVCRPCAGDGYVTNARDITWPDMNQAPEK